MTEKRPEIADENPSQDASESSSTNGEALPSSTTDAEVTPAEGGASSPKSEPEPDTETPGGMTEKSGIEEKEVGQKPISDPVGSGASSEDTHQTKADDAKPNPAPGTAENNLKKGKKWPILFGFVALALLFALGASGYVISQLLGKEEQLEQRYQASLQEQSDAVASQLDELKAQVSTLTSSLREQQKAHQDQLKQALAPVHQQSQQVQRNNQQMAAQVAQLNERVDAQQTRLMNLSTTSREDWLLAEAVYLLKLANQRVLLERSPINAIALLEAGDSIVQKVAAGLGDAELFAVRQALAREIAALKRVPSLDKEGIYLQLQALAEQVAQIPRVPPTQLGIPADKATPSDASTDDKSAVNDAEEDQSPWWSPAWDLVKDMAGVLDQYIRFDDVETPENPLITSHAAQMAALNVRVAIEQAQVAMIKEEPLVYQQALDKAANLLQEFYGETDAGAIYRESVLKLKSADVGPELPDISTSLKLLNDYLDQLHRVQPSAEGQL